ncbi:SdpI family protein [Flavobacterium sp. LC2016-12]|uniref:SdpI family protein n=1 Tax=Flavobacterium sp. LC2016-12 TaxID=2783794 RepID=UPI00188ACFA2|nr:SdpI family protein [Flavobacterium sp. LC2016-12]MBF4467314.1 SdpI family protein [Flavobacterium sp. LC2016-12]
MNLELKKELPIIGIVLTPFVYLAIIWNSLPEKVPVHWNYKGEIDRWGDKFSLITILFLLPVLIYVLMTFIPRIDPKNRISLMGGKFYQLKFILVLFMSLIALLVLYTTKERSINNPNLVFALMGAFFVILGNYFKVIQPNYFLGIRTPWTLENSEVWKATHLFAGKLWVAGGLLLVLGGFLLSTTFANAFVFVIIIMALVPVVYSFIKFKEIQKRDQKSI